MQNGFTVWTRFPHGSLLLSTLLKFFFAERQSFFHIHMQGGRTGKKSVFVGPGSVDLVTEPVVFTLIFVIRIKL